MKVKDLLTSDVKSCSPNADLAAAATIMWDHDCGVVPVVDDDRKVLGMITDRDICIAAATRLLSPAHIRVGDVMSGNVYACTPEDDVRVALKTMKDQQVRRLPVIEQGQLVGILSIGDVVARAESRKGAAISVEVVLDTLKSVTARSVLTA
jgi:CBS domain-containing protein